MNREPSTILAQQIQTITGLTPEERFWLITDTGMDYLDRFAPVSREMADMMRHNALFWKWWAQIWDMYDIRLVELVKQRHMDVVPWIDLCTGKLYRNGYLSFHKHGSLPHFPNQVVKALVAAAK